MIPLGVLGSAHVPAASGGYYAEVMADSPVAYWRMDETSGSTLVDALGTHHGTLFGGPTLAQASLLSTGGGTAISFDGSDDYYTVPHNSALNGSGAFSIEMWVRLDDPNANRLQSLLDKTNLSGSNGQWAIWWDNRSSQGSPQRLAAQFGTSPGVGGLFVWQGSAAATAIADGAHIVATSSGIGSDQTGRIYVNGTLASEVTGRVFTWNSGNTRAVEMGASSFKVDGIVDEVALYHAELSAARVLAHYNAGS